MPLTTEMFVLILYTVGFPLCFSLVQSAKLPGGIFFGLAYFFFLLSNIFTVIEAWFFEQLFNNLEHASMMIASFFILAAVNKITDH